MLRSIVHYLLIAIVGTLVVVLGSGLLKVAEVQGALGRANDLLNSGDPTGALNELQKIEPTAAFYPELLRRLDTMAVIASLRSSDRAGAEQRLRELHAQPYRAGLRPTTLWEALHSLPDPLIERLAVKLNGGAPVTAETADGLYRDELASLSKPRPAVREPAPRPAAAPAAQAAPTASTGGPPLAPEPAAPAAEAAEPPPSLAGTNWAVAASADTPCYDLSGKFLRRLEPGTIFEVSGIKNSSVGSMALCTAMHPGRLGAPILVRVVDVHMYGGPLAAASEEEQKLKVEFARLSAEVQAAKSGGVNALNPYAQAYETVREAHAEYWKKVKRLQTARDTARSSSDRIAYADQLREMKGEDIRLGQALDAAKKKYDEWNVQHPDQAASDPAVRRLQDDLARVQAEIRKLGTPP